MKKVLWNVARLVIARLASLSAVGQSNPSVTFANIPFAFRVGTGRYVISHPNEANLRITDLRNRGIYLPVHSVLGKATEGKGKLVFHRCGDVYFLSAIWFADGIGRQAFPFRTEKEMAARTGEWELAVLWTVR